MAATNVALTRGLQQIWVPEQACWVFVWTHDDGDLDRNVRLTYAVVSSPAEFQPEAGQFILTLDQYTQAYTYVYGVPYRIQVINGVVKVYFNNLTPALGNPRFATTEATPDFSNFGKSDNKPGWCLEGQFSREGIDVGPIIWNLKDQALHNNPTPILEVSDVNIDSLLLNGGPPGGTLVVEYQRDPTGRIIVDDQGLPQIALIDPKLGATADGTVNPDLVFTAQNYKIGYLGLRFVKDYFGIGLHGWLAATPDEPGPFDLIRLTADGLLYLQPGTVNQLIPSSPLDPIGCSGNVITYVSLRCGTDGNQVNTASYFTQAMPFTPPAAVKGGPPAQFDVTLGFVVNQGGTFKYWPVWPASSNINASPVAWTQTDRQDTQPGQTLTEQWWSWQAVAAVLN